MRPKSFNKMRSKITARKLVEELDQKKARTIKYKKILLGLSEQTFENLEDSFHAITQAAANALDIERVSIWMIDANTITCRSLFLLSTAEYQNETTLHITNSSAYLAALRRHEIIRADDARNDARTRELNPVLLLPKDIHSVLDVPIWTGGQLVAVLRCEHTVTPRKWHDEDEDFANQLAMLIRLAIEVAEHRRTEQALRESEIRFRSITQSINDAIISADNESNIIFWNAAAERIFGYTEKEIMGKPLVVLMPERYREAHTQAFTRVLATGKATVIGKLLELAGLHKDGHEFPIELSISVRYPEVTPLFMATIRDITERKHAEVAIITAKEAAEQANLAKSAFLSNMSHELRTPLNAILGFAQLLAISKDSPLTGQQRERVQHIVKGGEHLLELITEILDLAKIESGKLSLSVETVLTRNLLDDTLNLAGALTSKYEVNLVDRTSSELPSLRVDYLRTKQVLLNLLSNAIKYNYKGGTVWLDADLLRDHAMRLRISDTGCGIPLEKHGELFRPFKRLGVETQAIEGTGIGLVLTKALVEQMRGRVGFESTEGSGSSFWVDLPLAE